MFCDFSPNNAIRAVEERIVGQTDSWRFGFERRAFFGTWINTICVHTPNISTVSKLFISTSTVTTLYNITPPCSRDVEMKLVPLTCFRFLPTLWCSYLTLNYVIEK